MVNYQNAKIYRIVCNVTGKQYIGSTVSTLSTRLCQHKKALIDDRKCTSRDVLNSGDYNIVLIEDYPCERKEQLLQRERYYIETTECVNKNIPNRSKEEWYQNNKDVLADKYKLNREKRIEYQMNWNAANKDKLKKYQKTYKAKHEGVIVDLTEVDLSENIKLNIENLYDCSEFPVNEEIIELVDNTVNFKL